MTCTSILMAHLFIASKHMQEAAAGCIFLKKGGGKQEEGGRSQVEEQKTMDDCKAGKAL